MYSFRNYSVFHKIVPEIYVPRRASWFKYRGIYVDTKYDVVNDLKHGPTLEVLDLGKHRQGQSTEAGGEKTVLGHFPSGHP